MKTEVLLAGLVSCLAGAALAQTQLIVNGGFESQDAGEWQSSGMGAGLQFNSSLAHTGAGYLALGGVTSGALQTVYQTITLPTNTVRAELSYYFNVYSLAGSAGDALEVSIAYTNNSVGAVVDSETGANSAAGRGPSYYQLKTFDLTPWVGQTIEVVFSAATTAATAFSIDDVNVWIETTADIPPNDYFTNRTVLTGTSGTVLGNNTFATKETGEPNHAGNAGGDSLWWTWTAPANGTLSLSSLGSSFTTLLGVYTGDAVASLTRVASAVGPGEGGAGALKFSVAAGTAYQIAVDGYNDAFGTVVLAFVFAADTQSPVVSITYPAANAKLTNSTVTVQGLATDNIGVLAVEYRLENAGGTNAYQYLAAPATNRFRWSASITNLLPGLNTVRVFACDTSSNLSTTVSRTFTYAVVSPLTLTTTGNGTVAPRDNGVDLELNKPYTLNATAAAGYIFANWTDGAGHVLATTRKFTFIMTSGLVLQANFIPNPFIPLKGAYAGLFNDTNGFTSTNAGAFSATVTAQGSLTAKLQLAGGTYSLSGSFSAVGAYSNSMARPKQGPLSVLLQLDLTGSQNITGSVSSTAWSADLRAYRAMYSPTAKAPESGKKFTLVIPGATNAAAGPGGNGFGTVSVDVSGNIKFSGSLGDGTKVTQAGLVVGQGQWPFYLSPYGGKGLVQGWLSFLTNGAALDLAGPVGWFKLGGVSGKLYPSGFAFPDGVGVTGSVYAFTNGVRVLDWTNGAGIIELEGGNLPDSITNGLILGSNNKVSATNKLSKLTLTLTTASGLFQGSVPTAGGKSIPVSGVLLQNANAGYGLFLGTNQSGGVSLLPNP